MVVDNGVTIVDLNQQEIDEWLELGRSLWGEIRNMPVSEVQRIRAVAELVE